MRFAWRSTFWSTNTRVFSLSLPCKRRRKPLTSIPLFCRRISTSFSVFVFWCCSQGRGERAYDIYSRLLKERIVCLMGPVSTRLFFQSWRNSLAGRKWPLHCWFFPSHFISWQLTNLTFPSNLSVSRTARQAGRTSFPRIETSWTDHTLDVIRHMTTPTNQCLQVCK